MDDLVCWNCGASLAAIPRPISRHANCLSCHAELHACKLCRHFAPTRATRCAEERAEPPTRVDIANFCEWFEPARVGGGDAADRNAAAKARLDALFGGGGASAASPAEEAPRTPTKEEAARAELERLFGKKS